MPRRTMRHSHHVVSMAGALCAVLFLGVVPRDTEPQALFTHRVSMDAPLETTWPIDRRLQEQVRTRGHFVTGALIGAGVGAAGGAILYQLGPDFCDPADNTPYSTCTTSGPSLATTVIVGAVGGALLGGVIGSVIRSPAALTLAPRLGPATRSGPSMDVGFRLLVD
jgi:hypothetical protein